MLNELSSNRLSTVHLMNSLIVSSSCLEGKLEFKGSNKVGGYKFQEGKPSHSKNVLMVDK